MFVYSVCAITAKVTFSNHIRERKNEKGERKSQKTERKCKNEERKSEKGKEK